MERELGEIKSSINSMKYQIEDVHKILLGNGQPGLVQTMSSMQGSVRTLKWVVSVCIPILSLIVAYLSLRGGQ